MLQSFTQCSSIDGLKFFILGRMFNMSDKSIAHQQYAKMNKVSAVLPISYET